MQKFSKSGKRAGRGGAREIEVKLRVASRAEMLRRLASLGARPARGRVHEMNTLFDTPQGSLARRGQMVRIRVETAAGGGAGTARRPRAGRAAEDVRGGVTLTYKGPVAAARSARGARAGKRYKVREEHEVCVAGGAEPLERVLRALGLAPWFRYEKYRRAFRLPRLAGLVVDFDETPVGDFLELEGRPEQIDRAAALLGYGPGDYIVKSYGGLHMEALRMAGRAAAGPSGSRNEPTPWGKPPDMLFARRK